MLNVYKQLAQHGEHLLGELIPEGKPKQWSHYPQNDSIDADSGYQWFYHCHPPEDRRNAVEHGHIHLFARKRSWGKRTNSKAEQAFRTLTGQPKQDVATRHLIAIGLNAKGIPINLFTVNSWVTGDLMLNRQLTEDLLRGVRLNTEYSRIDTVIEGVLSLCRNEITELLSLRDMTLSSKPASGVLQDQSLELLSIIDIFLDAKIAGLFPAE